MGENLTIRRNKKIKKILLLVFLPIISGLLVWLVGNTILLNSAAKAPVDAYLVLGGSIKREIYIAQIAKKYPEIPILISSGSAEPCVVGLFRQANAPLDRVWLEYCSKSTFGNFFFSLPILEKWGVKHIKLVTSRTHLPRAKWLGQIILGSHGIWVETDIIEQKGIPGNRESLLKAGLDVIRSLMWAFASQFIEPKCTDIAKLSEVNVQKWCDSGFKCEHKRELKLHLICNP
ncbi:YdcF family protein [Okeania sp.]|uniref:YdcF family protein n=1 Tax=Okeania sp. TaxID=3100323 RepID=UPI002B4AFEF0|nr:YdcF family protein [Okeania sp.]MEB3342279.1 YdcF family protein [Okeania sp.]